MNAELEPLLKIVKAKYKAVVENPWMSKLEEHATDFYVTHLINLQRFLETTESELLRTHMSPLFLKTPKDFRSYEFYEEIKKEVQERIRQPNK